MALDREVKGNSVLLSEDLPDEIVSWSSSVYIEQPLQGPAEKNQRRVNKTVPKTHTESANFAKWPSAKADVVARRSLGYPSLVVPEIGAVEDRLSLLSESQLSSKEEQDRAPGH